MNLVYKMIGNVVYDLMSTDSRPASFKLFYEEGLWSEDYIKYSVTFGLTILVIIPLAMMKDITKFRITSLFGIISLSYVVLVSRLTIRSY